MCYVYYLVYFYKKVSQRKEDVIKVIRRRKYIYSTIHIYFLNLHVSGPVQGSTVQASVRPQGTEGQTDNVCVLSPSRSTWPV